MSNLLAYPYPTYVPDKVVASCVAVVVGLSLTAWFIQSCQLRFRPPRLNILLLISHLTICIELIVRATVNADEQKSKITFIITNSLFAIGQRMIIVGNSIFVMEIHHERSRLARGILIGTILSAVTSGILMAPANALSFDSDQINTSYLFRELSASLLLMVTILFYPVWYWSKTIKDMNRQGLVLISISSTMCVIVAIFNVIQALPKYYEVINADEGWFYTFQMAPIIFAHFTWSILHPKRSLKSARLLTLEVKSNVTLVNRKQLCESDV